MNNTTIIQLGPKARKSFKKRFKADVKFIHFNDNSDSLLNDFENFIEELLQDRAWTTKRQPFQYYPRFKALIIGPSQDDKTDICYTIVKKDT